MADHIGTYFSDQPSYSNWCIHQAIIGLEYTDDPKSSPTITLSSILALYDNNHRQVGYRAATLVCDGDKIRFKHLDDGNRRGLERYPESYYRYYDAERPIDIRGKGPTSRTRFDNEADVLEFIKEKIKLQPSDQVRSLKGRLADE